jgi:hypothetical protein
MEVDRIDRHGEAPEAVPPVVVIQYRTKAPLWILAITLSFLIPACGIMIYHRLVVAQLRAEAADARRVLQDWVNGARAGAVTPARIEPPAPLALNSQPIAEVVREPAPAPSPPPQPPRSQAPRPTPLPAPSAPATQVRPPSAATAARGQDPAPPGTTAGPAQASTAARVPPPQPDPPGAAPLPPSEPPVLAEVDRPRGLSPPVPSAEIDPFDQAATLATEPPLAAASDRAGRPSGDGPAPGAAPAGPIPEAAPFDQAPLPSKEETLRAIQEEAASKQADLRVQHQARQAEYRRLRYDERRKFRDELRDVLASARRAGTAIDQLCLRYGYDFDPDTFARASRAWAASSRSWDEKIRVVRALDLPEPMILNFLSDDLHGRLRSRNGPRDSNEVRIRAAQLLLNCEPPPPDSADRPADRAATAPTGRAFASPAARVPAAHPR